MSIVSTSFVLRLISRMADVKDQQVDHEVVWPNADCVDLSFGKTAIDNHDLRVAQIKGSTLNADVFQFQFARDAHSGVAHNGSLFEKDLLLFSGTCPNTNVENVDRQFHFCNGW